MKTFVLIGRTNGEGEISEAVEIFESEDYFLFYWQKCDPKTVLGYKILSPEQVEDYLEPFKRDVIVADRKKAEAKAILDDIKRANKTLFNLTGADYFFQDDENIVYKTDECDGKFVYFETIEIKRTRRAGETKGSLSLTEARNAGFEVEGK